MDELRELLNALPSDESDKLIKWFKEKTKKKSWELKTPSANFRPYVKRRDIVWVDFGQNVGQEISGPHPAVVIFANDASGTVLVVPLTKEKHNSYFVNDIGPIDGMEQTVNYAKIDQIKSISRLRIQTKLNPINQRRYNNYNRTKKEFNNPKATSDQMNIIDSKISDFRQQSK